MNIRTAAVALNVALLLFSALSLFGPGGIISLILLALVFAAPITALWALLAG